MSDYNISILVDAKQEYTKQLINILKPEILSSFITIYNEAVEVCEKKREPDFILLTFQDLLSQVPKWNQNMIEDICGDITRSSGCDWLDDLITAIFVSHTKILTTVRVSNKSKKINLKIPCMENFIHKTFICVARELWKNPDLLHEKNQAGKLEYQKNIRTAEKIIGECVENTIRTMLPVKNILKEYLYEHDTETQLEKEEDDLYLEEIPMEKGEGGEPIEPSPPEKKAEAGADADIKEITFEEIATTVTETAPPPSFQEKDLLGDLATSLETVNVNHGMPVDVVDNEPTRPAQESFTFDIAESV